MHRPIQKVYTTSGKQTPVVLDRYVNGYGVTVTMKTTGAIYTVMYSNDDPSYDPNGNPWTTSYLVSGTWLNMDDPVMVNASTNRSSNFAYPPRAVMINCTSKTSAGNPLVLTLVPMGMDGN
jgi:hypothetical protein